MSAWAKPGVKCVCVDADGSETLVHGGVYTVRSTCVAGPLWADAGSVGLRLYEIILPVDRLDGIEPGYRVSRFRPLVTRTQEQDLELFLPHLTDLRVREPS